MTITRTRIRCRERACPWRDDEEMHKVPWCRGIEGHKCFGGVTHQHHPRRSQGGKEIVALLCAGAHDIIDNGSRFSNDVIERDGQRIYRILHEKRGILYERVLGVAATGEGESSTKGQRVASVPQHALPSPAAPAPSDGEERIDAANVPADVVPSPPSPGAPIRFTIEELRAKAYDWPDRYKGEIGVVYRYLDWLGKEQA